MHDQSNPYRPGQKVITKFKSTEVEATVTQIYGREVQVRTPGDNVLRWRTCKTVWYPPDNEPPHRDQPAPAPFTEPAVFSPPVRTPDQGVPVAPLLSPSNITPSEDSIPKESIQGIIPPPSVDQQFITVCGQEEFEDLQRTRKAKRRTARRKR